MQGYNNFFFDGDANDPNVQDVIRTKFISLAQSVLVPPFFCKTIPECTQTNVQVTVGAIQGEYKLKIHCTVCLLTQRKFPEKKNVCDI